MGFEASSYDSSLPLVIDPGLVWSTFLGGIDYDTVLGVALDSLGNTYVTGFTRSTGFPTTPGAYDSLLEGPYDGFVTKIEPEGEVLVYSTLLGGSSGDWPHPIAVDPAGNPVISGWTMSEDFPVTDESSYNGGSSDCFITKLDEDGDSLIFSRFLGGEDDGGCVEFSDRAYGLALTHDGSILLCGRTQSADFPTTPGAYEEDHAPNYGWDGYVSRLGSSGDTLTYSTFLRGSSTDYPFSVMLGDSGKAYITGMTDSDDFPVTSDAYDTSLSGTLDIFISEIDSTGGFLRHSTYLGGSDLEKAAYGIGRDSLGNVVVAGGTRSDDFPMTDDSLYGTLGGPRDLFIAKLSSDLSTLVYSTYLGGSDEDRAWALAVDRFGNINVSGETESNDFPVTPDADYPLFGGGDHDAFLARLDAGGQELLYSSYIGGSSSDRGFSLATNTTGIVVLGGTTSSIDFPATPPEVYDTTLGDGSDSSDTDGFISRFFFDVPTTVLNTHTGLGSVFLQSYPNPFNPAVTIQYYLSKSGFIAINAYDIRGRHVRSLVAGYEEAGAKMLVWDGCDDRGIPLGGGLYFLRLWAHDLDICRKVILLR
ncbi:MAG: SBBP repeat-containing protein [Candidatus Eisenbacteria bacterium]